MSNEELDELREEIDKCVCIKCGNIHMKKNVFQVRL